MESYLAGVSIGLYGDTLAERATESCGIKGDFYASLSAGGNRRLGKLRLRAATFGRGFKYQKIRVSRIGEFKLMAYGFRAVG